MTTTEGKAHRLRPYPSYKDSGVEWIGAIPAHWLAQPIRRVFSVSGGTTPDSNTPAFWDGDVLWATPEDISKVRGKYLTDTRRKITQEGAAKTGLTLLPEGTLLLTTRAPIGNLCLTAAPMTFNQGCKALKAPSHILPEHFFHVLNAAVPALQAAGKGTTFLELSASNLKSFILPVPPLEEQQAIAAYLDRETERIDELIREQEALLDDLSDKRQATITHAVTKGLDARATMKPSGVEWIGEIPAHWLAQPIRRVFSVSGGTTPDSNTPAFWDGDVLWATPEDISKVRSKYLTDTRRKITQEGAAKTGLTLLPEGTLLLTTRAPIGNLCLTAAPMTFNQGCKALKAPSHILPEHFFHVLNAAVPALQAAGKGTTFLELSASNLKSFILPVPPLEEQQAIAAYLDEQLAQIDQLREEVRANIQDMRIHRSALITAAVTGKIDVRPEAE
ncbi:type I restriction-modification protein subunit S [Deinococcus arenae]|uniref:Type I restriction-modification protein subunit S n=1 Tax=Deinococcus arenae TaxID=1452751 RepID=A0A8H9LA40_9DEIO|nr:restriction endonuclease subunit S [Deinococcus arenae]GGM53883.1 type I restriction-modification protein subunit S [Deinococcus arenae]